MMNLKKRNCLLTALLVLASVIVTNFFPSVSLAAYLPKNSEKSNGASNIALIHTGYYNPNDYDGMKVGEYDKERFLPYVGYLNDKGVAEDYFFDTFLMVTAYSPYKGSLGRYYDWAAGSRPGTLQDWKWAMDRVFEKGIQLDGLEAAVEQVSGDLKDPGKRVNVYFTLPFPDPQSKDFGDFNGDGTVKNLESLDTRKALIRWYVDTMAARFEQQNYKHLKLSGFYWLQKDLDTTVAGEQESVKYAAEYLRERGMRLGWTPWFGAREKGNGQRLGFDFSAIQPDHYSDESSTMARVEEAADIAYANEAGVEVEFDQRMIDLPRYRQAFYNYLITGVKKQFMNDALVVYYQDVYALYDLYHSEFPAAKQMYKDIYKFAKGTFTAPTGNLAGRVVDRDGNGMAGATLIDQGGTVVTTDVYGKFEIKGLYATQNTFVVEKPGMQGREVKVDIRDQQTLYRDVALQNAGEGPDKTVPDYAITLPSKLATMDIGAVWTPVVIDRNDKGQKKAEAVFTSSDPGVIEVLPEGKIRAVQAGTAVLRAQVGTLEAESVAVEVAAWTSHRLEGTEAPLQINKGFDNPVLRDPLQGSTQYVVKEGSTLKITHKYNSGNDMWMVFDHAGANKLYGMKEWRLSPNVNKDASPDLARSSVMLWPDVSDWVGPYIVGANQNGNGNGQDFTGGNHNYDGGENSSATGRTVQYNVRVDGKEPQDGKVISGKKVKIEVVNRIQAFNTKEQDGSGREILQETVTYEVEGGKVQVHTEIEPLEDITLYRYYGLQSVNGAWNHEIRYYAGETEVARGEAGKYSDSGMKSRHPDVDKYWLSSAVQDGSQHQLLVSLDRHYGLGQLQYLADDQPVAFTQAYGKSYFLQVFNKSAVLKKGAKVAWRGQYHFFSTPAQERTIKLSSSFGNGYAVPEEEASYQWEVIGDAAQKVSETGSHIRIKGVKEGTTTIKATIAYNGKSQTLESTVQVGDDRRVDTTELQQLLDEAKMLLQQTGNEYHKEKGHLAEASTRSMRKLKQEGFTQANVDEATAQLKEAISIFKKTTQTPAP
ncbi:DUF4855 domain-containing protein [Paenibacillus elgii]|uniref:DUF4855 domain-containing protein n=1 Tax=Paenibacillus elgii TaxID=189691 RepID=UPI0009ED272A|nr:DUF4855 domain-containing protein [Paenibacillus elgii]